jgi:CDP-glycerol glycerophosphotransferase (TagB/SpsB family)
MPIPIKIVGKNKSSERDEVVSASHRNMKKTGRPITDNNRMDKITNNSLRMTFPITKNRNKIILYKSTYRKSKAYFKRYFRKSEV